MNTSTDKTNTYWGLLATVLISVFIFTLFSLIQISGILAYAYTTSPDSFAGSGGISSHALNQYLINGDAIASGQIPATFIGVALIIWFASIRKPLTIDTYLDLHIPKAKPLLLFTGIIILLLILMEAINLWLGRSTPQFMIDVYSNTKNIPLLWVAVVIGAPFFEEFLFRGFLFEGLSRSILGLTGTIILTSAVWALVHAQYGWLEIICIFFIGIVLCLAKIKSQSLYTPILLHMMMNLIASIGMALLHT